jgi:hypothetical protein
VLINSMDIWIKRSESRVSIQDFVVLSQMMLGSVPEV